MGLQPSAGQDLCLGTAPENTSIAKIRAQVASKFHCHITFLIPSLPIETQLACGRGMLHQHSLVHSLGTSIVGQDPIRGGLRQLPGPGCAPSDGFRPFFPLQV